MTFSNRVDKLSPHATRYRHGETGTRLYNIWSTMKARTSNPNTINYHLYGGKNINVCEEWKVYERFRDWSLSNGYSSDKTIDRIDGNSDYCPSNCRWVTMKEQQNNRCNNHLISFNGETKTLSQWADTIGIAQKTLRRRIVDKEWPIEKALTTPLQTQYRRRFTNRKVGEKK